MADSTPAAAEPVAVPADVKPAESELEQKAPTTDDAPVTNAVADEKNAPEEKSAAEEKTNGADSEKKDAGRSPKNDRKGRDFKRDHHNRNNNSRGGRHHKAPRTNEYENMPETDDPNEIRQQVEFYFSIQNLSTDRHLFHECKGPENRPVSIKHLSTFKRMKRFQPYSAIVAALRESETLDVVDDGNFAGTGNEGVKRKTPIDIPLRPHDDEHQPTTEELFERLMRTSRNALDANIYAKGFIDEGDVGQLELENFFKPYGAIMVRKRRDEDGNWKGSVFVEFDSADTQESFLALDPKPKFNDRELTIMSKKGYSEMKCKEKGIVPAWLRENKGESRRPRDNSFQQRGRGGGRGGGRGQGRGRGRGGGGGRGRDRDSYRKRDRSRSRSGDEKDWNGRRDRFQKSRDYKDGRGKKDDSAAEAKETKKELVRDADGVPVVQSTTDTSSKRKADDDARDDAGKKSKMDFRDDE